MLSCRNDSHQQMHGIPLSLPAHGAQNWETANKVARQEIDEYMRSAGPAWDKRRAAIDALRTEFDAKFPAEDDPALIQEYLEKIGRDLRYEAEDAE